MSNRHRVVIVGGGFGGLCAARSLRRAPVDVVLVDRRNHHLFQPLLYQVATGGLSPANIAAPLRALVRGQPNTRVVLGEVTGFDLETRVVEVKGSEDLPYDDLIVAAGAGNFYFGRDDWADRAPGLKSLEEATRIRRQVLLSFERAAQEPDPERRAKLMTFVVIGGGPTGVELAGAIAEVAHRTLKGEFRKIDTADAKVLLVEGVDRVLRSFTAPLSAVAERSLEKLGVTVLTGRRVESIEQAGVTIRDESGALEVVATESVFWAAGVRPSPLGALLSDDLDRSGRVKVMPDCSLPARPEVAVIGDMAHFSAPGGTSLPGLAPVAMQQGRYAARRVVRRLRRRPVPAFKYFDKGNMATIGRKMAVVELGALRMSGLLAWFAWLFVHLLYLAEFQNRVLVLIQWGWNYVTRNRSARLITGVPRADE